MSGRRKAVGVDFDLFDLDDLSEAILLSPSETGFSLLVDGDEIIEVQGEFVLGDGPGTMPTEGVATGFRLIDDGEVRLALTGLSLPLESLLGAVADVSDDDDYDEDDDDEDDEGETSPQDEALLDLFDVDPIQTGVLLSASETEFRVDWWGEVGTFVGEFVLNEAGRPVSGSIEAFELRESGEVETSLSGLDVDLTLLLGAMARDEGLTWPSSGWSEETYDPDEEYDDDDDDDYDDDEYDDWEDGLLAALLAGDDRLKGGGGDDRLGGAGGEDRLIGGRGDDELSGGDGDDRLLGQKGSDTLGGGDGDDKLKGGAGKDLMDGGAGRDVMIGGGGADTFVFDDVADSGLRREADVIRGFDGRRDVIDLSGIDADEDRRGDQAIEWSAGRGFSGDGEAEALLKGRKLFVDLDGDGRADFQLKLVGGRRIDEDDFLL